MAKIIDRATQKVIYEASDSNFIGININNILIIDNKLWHVLVKQLTVEDLDLSFGVEEIIEQKSK
jgi:hypothetical protein